MTRTRNATPDRAPHTALEAAQLLAQHGMHSHLHAEHQSSCISGDCDPTPAVLHGTVPTVPHKPGGLVPILEGLL